MYRVRWYILAALLVVGCAVPVRVASPDVQPKTDVRSETRASDGGIASSANRTTTNIGDPWTLRLAVLGSFLSALSAPTCFILYIFLKRSQSGRKLVYGTAAEVPFPCAPNPEIGDSACPLPAKSALRLKPDHQGP